MTNGLCTVWTHCLLAAAIQIASEGKIRIGWTVARVEFLKARPTQCYRCWQYGHVRNTCTVKKDHSNACFNCGNQGHAMKDCRAKPYCVLCEGKGRNPEHRLDTNLCKTLRDFNQRNQTKQAGQPDRRSGKKEMVVDNDQSSAM